MAKIVAVAENFAFGPAGRLLTVLKHLKKRHTITFIGAGTALQLARLENSLQTIQLETSSKTFSKDAASLFRKADILISSLDRPSISLAYELGLPSVYIDGLFWRWETIPEPLRNVSCYIKQRNLLEDHVSQRISRTIRNLHEVGPIVEVVSARRSLPLKRAVVGFGGMEAHGWYKVGEDTRYPYIFSSLLINRIDFGNFDEVVFTGNATILKQLAQMHRDHIDAKRGIQFSFQSLSHDRFLTLLSSASVLITTPGGQTSYEAFAHRVPVIFLPPSNDTQYLWLQSFIEEGCGLAAIHWKEFFPALSFRNKNPRSMLRKLFEQIDSFEKDGSLQETVAKRISSFLQDGSLLQKQVDGQKRYFSRLGPPGGREAAALVEQTIFSKDRDPRGFLRSLAAH